MPYRIQRPCKAFNCPNTTSNANGFCNEHQVNAREQRGSARQRGYDRQWQQFRVRYLREHPLCEDCLVQPFPGEPPQPATEVHHEKKLKDFPELKYDKKYLHGLCHRHHSIRTARGE